MSPETQADIVAVQTALGLNPDGQAGPLTWAAIRGRLAPVPAEAPAPMLPTPSGDKVDARSEVAIGTLLPAVQPLARQLVRDAAAKGITIKVTSGTRSYDEQNALYAQGRSTGGAVVTNAQGGYSNHNFGLAFDVTVFEGDKPVWDGPQYKTLGALGKALGLAWGGDWKSIDDEPHFELRPAWAKDISEGQMLAELRQRHANGTDALA